ncbi:MAG TPA: hypothetical protein VLF91_03535 [Candidatus Saccharimonadales bacterium]|nr:hypothetical protein [Candidatus Saccharimonadales bacterium]
MSRQAHEQGQTIIALLVYMAIVITLTTIAATVTIINIRASSGFTNGEQALVNAESGADDALLQLLRDPSYSGGTVPFPNGAATISISGTTQRTIVSRGESGGTQRSITVVATDSSHTITLVSWNETP